MYGSDAAYERLRARVERGTLVLVNTGGIPRGLTSILTKVLGEGRLGPGEPVALFDRIIHEPFLQLSNRDAPGGVYAKLLEEVEGVEREAAAIGRDLHRHPASLLVKNNSYHLTGSEWEDFLALVRCAIVSVRNPALTFTSLARAMARIAMANFPEDMTLKGRMAKALEEEDFSSLGGEDARHFGFHSLIGHPDVQRKLWGELAETLGAWRADQAAHAMGFSDWGHLADEFAGTPAHDVYTLPEILRAPLEFYRVGWPSLREFVNRLGRAGTRYVVVDSTDLQLAPDYFMARLREFVGECTGELGGPRLAPEFDVGSAGTTSGLLYERVSQTSAIEPPTQIPIPADRLPSPYRGQLGTAYAIYVSLLRDPMRLRSPRCSRAAAPTRNISDLDDPTFAYCSFSLEDDLPQKEAMLALFRYKYPNLADYFGEIDRDYHK